MNTEALTSMSTVGRTDRVERDHSDNERLPVSYGIDTLVFIVRDPTSAQAYWEISAARIDDAIASLGGGKAILRLIGASSGCLLAEHEVDAQCGSYGVALPEPDRSYAVELAIVHHYRKVVLARSNVVQAPPRMQRPASAPVLIGRQEQLRALELGLTLERHDGELSGRLPVNNGAVRIDQLSSGGSESRLSASGPERGSGAKPRFGSEHRLARGD